jgi:ketosteroid isomerase-like protein
MRRFALAMALVLVGTAAVAQDVKTDSTRKAEAALRAADAALNAAITPEQITSFYAKDAVFMGASSGLIEGHVAIRKHLDGVAKLPGIGKEAATEKVEVSAAGDIGFALGRLSVALEVDAGKGMVAPGKYLRVWKKQVDGWKVTAAFLNYIPATAKSQ